MNTTNTTTTHKSSTTSSVLTDFLKKKYTEALDIIIPNIKANAVHLIERFITNEKKYKGIPKSRIPRESDVQTGLEPVAGLLGAGHLSLIKGALVIAYDEPSIGETFSTKYFQDKLKCLPERFFPGCTITLSDRILGQLGDVNPQRESFLKLFWKEENFDDKIKVEFMGSQGEHNTGDKMNFALWFAEQLAKEYLKWCKKEQDLANEEITNKTIAIDLCIKYDIPYSTVLTSDTLLRSTGLANFSSFDCGNYKKRRTDDS
jgi:hypothetical protein